MLRPRARELSQFFTPAWFAQLLYDRYFPHLTSKDVVWEPSIGTGACLAAVPPHIGAQGTEIDPELARIAAERTGRRVDTGDFRTARMPEGMSAVFGNPPLELASVERLLERCAPVLSEGNSCGLVMPSYFFQTSSTLVRLNTLWTIRQDMIPRDLFNRPEQMKRPLIFALFTRDSAPQLVGFCGYRETADTRQLPEGAQRLMDGAFQGPRSVWREVLSSVLRELGGEAPLSSIYRAVEGRRPTATAHWREQIRKVAQTHFTRVGEGVYALPS